MLSKVSRFVQVTAKIRESPLFCRPIKFRAGKHLTSLGTTARPADDTLNYITQQGVRNRVSLDLVDREFSTQLNKERNIDFALPPAK